jgi:hypothetical protein
MVAAVYADAQRSTASCAPLTDRMDAYKLAAEAGHTAGRVTYAQLLLIGREVSDKSIAYYHTNVCRYELLAQQLSALKSCLCVGSATIACCNHSMCHHSETFLNKILTISLCCAKSSPEYLYVAVEVAAADCCNRTDTLWCSVHCVAACTQSWTDTLPCSTDTSLAAAAGAAAAAYRLTPERLTAAVTHLHAAVAAGSSTAAYTLALLLLSGLAPAPFNTATIASSCASCASHSADVTDDVTDDVASNASSSTTAGGTDGDKQCDSSTSSTSSCSVSNSNGTDGTAAAATTSSTNTASAAYSSSSTQHQQQQEQQQGLGLPHAVGDAVRCTISSCSGITSSSSTGSAVLDDTATAIGLLHIAAAGGVHEARLALGVR